MSGVVAAIGAKISDPKVGDAVYGYLPLIAMGPKQSMFWCALAEWR
jgi:hypothetical protein